MEPIRTYRTVIDGQEVEVRVYPPDVSRTESRVIVRSGHDQVDHGYLDEPESPEHAKQRRAWEKVNPRDWEF